MKCKNCGFLQPLSQSSEFGFCPLERKIVKIDTDTCHRRKPTISIMNTHGFYYWSGQVLVLECLDCNKQYYSTLKLRRCFACKGKLVVVGRKILRISVSEVEDELDKEVYIGD